MEDAAGKPYFIQNLNPLTKLVVTAAYVVIAASFGKYQPLQILPLLLYPLTLTHLAGLSYGFILRRIWPLLIMLLLGGLLNPLFERQTVVFGNITLAQGWLVSASFFLRGALCIWAAALLAATTKMSDICASLRIMRLPRILVWVVSLCWRYSVLLLEETSAVTLAYRLRAPAGKGVHYKAWGSLAGQILLRSYDQAERLATAMTLRGFDGDFPDFGRKRIGATDVVYVVVIVGLLLLFRFLDLSAVIGGLLVR